MDDESRPDLLVIPTELDRRAPWLDLAILGLAVVVVRWLLGFGFNWPVMLAGGIVVLLVALHVLSGEPATDVEGIGLIATGLRSKLGLRRAHEWIIVAARYWNLAIRPVWVKNCRALSESTRRQTINWLARLSGWMRWLASRVRSWASAIRYNLLAVLAKVREFGTGRIRRGSSARGTP